MAEAPPVPHKKVSAGPPPYTITCEQPSQPVAAQAPLGPPPGYSENGAQGTQPIGWCGTPPYPVVQQQPMPVPQLSSSSVVYVSRQPQAVIINQSGLISSNLMSCPKCRALVNTRIVHRPGCQTHLWACVFCVFGCWICAPLPYCSPGCMDEEHFCANCGAHIATVA